MTRETTAPSLIRPLSPGNIVNVGLQLYRLHWKTYLRVAAIATGWMLIPFVAGAIVLLFYAAVQDYWAWLGLLIPAWIGLLVYCGARFLSNSAAIVRLAFGELMQRPETAAVARRYTQQRQWSFLMVSVLVSLILGAVVFGAYIIGIIVMGLLFVGVAGLSVAAGGPTSDPFSSVAVTGLVVVLTLLVFLALFSVALWFSMRLSLADLPVSVEEGIYASDAVGRSWQLTQRRFWRLTLVLTIAFLITLPIQTLAQILALLTQGAITFLFPTNVAAIYLSVLLSWTISLGFGIFLLPLWRSVQTVIYFDFRSYREGLGLSLPEPTDSSRADATLPTPLSDRLFNRVILPTPESVDLEFTLAGVGNRALALMIDYLILGALLLLLWIGGLIFSTQLLIYLEQWGLNASQVPLWLLAIALLLTFAIYTGYFVYFETARQGQTPGKRFAQIRVVRDDGRPVGLAQATLRALLRPLDDFFFVGSLLIWLGKQEKRIGDLVAGTLVVQEERPAPKVPIAISDEAKQLATQLPQTTHLENLRPDDFAVIRAYLQRRSNFAPNPRSNLSLELARQIRGLILLETVPPNLTSDCFLEAVYLAYQQHTF